MASRTQPLECYCLRHKRLSWHVLSEHLKRHRNGTSLRSRSRFCDGSSACWIMRVCYLKQTLIWHLPLLQSGSRIMKGKNKYLLSEVGSNFVKPKTYTDRGLSLRNSIQSDKYKIRHQSKYLYRMRKEIITHFEF